MPEREGRLGRWSRLKQKGGADADEQAGAEQQLQERLTEDNSPAPAAPAAEKDPNDLMPDAARMPGGVMNRNFVAPMVPLAAPEDGEMGYEAAPAAALAMLEGDAAHDAAAPPDLEERELTPEEEEIVSQLPPIESLKKESDFTPFLAQGVPEFIKRRAMGALWRSDSFFGFQDGLDDYAENYRVIDKVINAATDSSYRPGKGYDLPEDDEVADETETAEAEVADADTKTASDTQTDTETKTKTAEETGDDAPDTADGGNGSAEAAPDPKAVDESNESDEDAEVLVSSSVRKPEGPRS